MVDLATLSHDEQRELYDRLAFQFAKAPAATKADSEMFSLITDVLAESYAKADRGYFPAFVKAYGHQRYADAAAAIYEVIENGCGKVIRRGPKHALIKLGLECLIDSMIERNIPVSPGTILDQHNFYRVAIEKNYPGYLRSRMLHRIITLA